MEGHRVEIPDLASFVVPNVKPTDRELGKGAYGSVEEVEIPGAVCAAKKIHTEFLSIGSREDIGHIVSKFASECRLMSKLRHPHIVQFLGVCYLLGEKLPSLVMERLDTNLHELLETTPNLPLAVKNSILLDTAQGLLFLHSQSPPIIHRDLTARNVLLNSAMVAKIADLGVARIVNLQPDQLVTMTQGPGNIVYMPPEVMGEHTQYNSSLDIFSFGNIALFTLTQEFIGPKLKAATYIDHVGKLNARTEIERREHGFHILYHDLGEENPLTQLIKDCLQNQPTDRPNATGLVKMIKKISSDMESLSKLELMKQLSSKEKENRQMEDENRVLMAENEQLQDQIMSQQLSLREEIQKKDTKLTELREVVRSQKEQIESIEKRLVDMLAQGSISSEEGKQLRTEIDKMKPAQDELVFPLTFKWEKRSDLPYGATADNFCITNGKVYINARRNILEYTPDTDTWVKLPTPATERHGMLSHNGKLTLVGGALKETNLKHSPVIQVWDGDIKQWTEPYPRMPMGRRGLGCASYQHYLIVAGGIKDEQLQSTTSVEILDTKSGQWFKAPPMKYNGADIQSVIIGQRLYFLFTLRGILTYSKSLLRVSLPTLISHTMQGKNRDTSIWEKMPDVPLYMTTLFSIGNMLLTAGGNHSGTVITIVSALHIKTTKVSADIHLFNPHTNQWLKIGELPEPRTACACTVLPSGKLLVAGGEDSISGMREGPLSTVYTALITGSYFDPSHF